MGHQVIPILLILAIIGVLLTLAILGSRYLMRKAIRDVILLFRSQGAITPATAITAEELGLTPRAFLDIRLARRDYRPQALRSLAQANIIKTAGEGWFYLSEDELDASPLKDRIGID